MPPCVGIAMRELGRCLVTGGAGFIGSHLVEALIGLGNPPRVLDDLSTGVRQQVAPQAEFLFGSLLDDAALAAAVADVATIFHLAAATSVPQSWTDPEATERINALGTVRLLDRAQAAGVRRLIYAASSSCYASQTGPVAETAALAPASPYAVSKLAGEGYARAYAAAGKLEVVSLRLFNVYGPRQRAESAYSGVIARFAHLLSVGGTPIIYGDGEQSRDFVHVQDVVAALLQAARVENLGAGEVFNIGSGTAVTVKELLRMLCWQRYRPLAPRYEAARIGEVRHSQADISRARQFLGWEPTIPLEAGLLTV